MPRFKPKLTILAHFAGLSGSLALAVVSGQNPRIILYGLSLGLLFRFITVWLLPLGPNILVNTLSRAPEPGDKSKPLRNQHTRRMSGLPGYIFGILTLMFMVGVLQAMGSGFSIFTADVLIPELTWGLLIAILYWFEDLASHNIIICRNESTAVNFGYNISGYYFLLAAIFISGFLILILLPFRLILDDIFPADHLTWMQGLQTDWVIIFTLAAIRFAYEIRLPQFRYKSGSRLPG